MTKKEIVRQIAERADIPQVKTKLIVQWTFEAIIETLVQEGRIELRNFGVFEVKTRRPRKARNPKTERSVDVPARNVVTFQPGKLMEEKVEELPKAFFPKPKGNARAAKAKAAVVPSAPADAETVGAPTEDLVGVSPPIPNSVTEPNSAE